MELERVKRLINLMETKWLSELELEEDNFKVVLKKGNFSSTSIMNIPIELQSSITSQSTTKNKDEFIELTSSLVGYFYRSGSVNTTPYVQVGDKISPTQPVCAFEVMGTMHEIKSDVYGEIAGILIENGQVVEYGQVLFLIKPK